MDTRHVAARSSVIGTALTAVLFAAAACGDTRGDTEPPTATPHVERPTGERMIDVGGYELAIRCFGQNAPTVIFENGGFPVQDLFGAELSDDVARELRVCTYDRAGTGESEAGPQPRDATQITRELALLLDAAGEVGPYVLVTWSAGALYTPLFAVEHPDDVAGYVFIDPRLAAYQLEVGIDPMIRQTASAFPQPYVAELDAWDASAQEVLDAGPLPARPLVVLTQGSPEGIAEFATQPGGYALWRDSHAEFAASVPGGRHIVVDDASHRIWADNPEAVLEAIRSVASSSAE
jgi:pimeloyl-ACP methyl ester carboxylesterase